VDELTRNAAAQREQLRGKQAAADKAMNDITEALSLASDRKREVEVLQVRGASGAPRGREPPPSTPPLPLLQASLARAEKETLGRKGDVEAELSSIAPMLEAAKEAVGSIKKENLDEIRSLKARGGRGGGGGKLD